LKKQTHLWLVSKIFGLVASVYARPRVRAVRRFLCRGGRKERFLQVQVSDLLFAGDENVRVDQVRTSSRLMLF
jgi:hypothetical protein